MRNHTNHTRSRAASTRVSDGPTTAVSGGTRAGVPELFGTATVGERGQVVIPQAARERLGIRAGDRLVVLGGASGAEGLLLVRAQTVGALLAKTARKLTSFRESVRRATEAG